MKFIQKIILFDQLKKKITTVTHNEKSKKICFPSAFSLIFGKIIQHNKIEHISTTNSV